MSIQSIGGAILGYAALAAILLTILGLIAIVGRTALRGVSAIRENGQPGALSFESARSASEIFPAAIHFFSADGWTVTSQGRDNASFSYPAGPSCLVALFFGFFGIVPGLLYLIFSKHTVTASLSIQRGRGGGSITSLSWSRSEYGRPTSEGFWRMVNDQEPELDTEPEPARLQSGTPDESRSPEDSCSRCGASDLRAREMARVPLLCDACLAQSRRRRRRS